MKKAINKSGEIKYIAFEDFVAYGRKSGDSFNNGHAWGFDFNGYKVTYENDKCYTVATLEGVRFFTNKDVLVVGAKGEIYPCKKDIFE